MNEWINKYPLTCVLPYCITCERRVHTLTSLETYVKKGTEQYCIFNFLAYWNMSRVGPIYCSLRIWGAQDFYVNITAYVIKNLRCFVFSTLATHSLDFFNTAYSLGVSADDAIQQAFESSAIQVIRIAWCWVVTFAGFSSAFWATSTHPAHIIRYKKRNAFHVTRIKDIETNFVRFILVLK